MLLKKHNDFKINVKDKNGRYKIYNETNHMVKNRVMAAQTLRIDEMLEPTISANEVFLKTALNKQIIRQDREKAENEKINDLMMKKDRWKSFRENK